MTLCLVLDGLEDDGPCGASSLDRLQLIPVPRHVSVGRSLARVGPMRARTNLPKNMHYIIDLFREEIIRKAVDGDLVIDITHETINTSDLPTKIPKKFLDLIPGYFKDLFVKEGYYLSISTNNITIVAEKPRGIFYGITTLVQLCTRDGCLPCIEIIDWPSMEVRGVSDENARGQAGSVEGLKRYARFLGLLKANTLQVNLEDMFASKKHPKSTDLERGCYTKAEIREVVDHAAKYFVEVTPIQTTGGHYDNVFALQEYKHLAEFEHVAMCFDISNLEIYDYIADIIGEEVEAWYKSSSFHMACDESWDVGKGRSREMVESKGLGKAYLDHYTRCYEIIKEALEKKHGKGNFRVYIYHDILVHHPEVLEGLPRENLVIDVWRYTPKVKYGDVDTVIEHDLAFVVSPSVMDYQRVLPAFSASEKNIINLIVYGYTRAFSKGKSHLFLGQVNTSWGDFRNENHRDLRMHGYALGSSVSWNVDPWLDFENKNHAVHPALVGFRKGFYTNVLGIDPAKAGMAAQLDSFKHAILNGGTFKSRLGPNLLHPKAWAHPLQHLPPEKSKKYPLAVEEFTGAMEWCASLAEGTIDHAYFLDSLKFAFRFMRFYCKKVLLGKRIKPFLNEHRESSVDAAILADIDWLVDEIMEMKAEYRRVWEINCKPNCYGFLLAQYDAMARFYGEIKQSLVDGTPLPRPFVPSEYIYVDEVFEPDNPVQVQGKFTIAGVPDKAFLQAYAISHANIILNGKEVGHVESRNTLSWVILDRMVKFWDVTGSLVEGENVITIDLVNNVGSWSLLNVLLEWQDKEGRKSHAGTGKDWNWRTGEGEPWRPVRSLGPPPSIIGGLSLPVFERGRRSHFTRMLGLIFEYSAKLPPFLVRFVAWLGSRLHLAL